MACFLHISFKIPCYSNQKRFRRFIPTIFNSCLRLSCLKTKITTASGAETHDPVEIAYEFNSFFSKVGERMASNILPPSDSLKFSYYTKSSFFLHKISEQEVQTLISKLDEKKAIRHGDITTKFLKLSNSVVTPFLTHIFNRCMTEGIYPNYLKEAQIVLLHKSGDSTICSNYRPISLLPQFNKFLKNCCMTDYIVTWKILVCCLNISMNFD